MLSSRATTSRTGRELTRFPSVGGADGVESAAEDHQPAGRRLLHTPPTAHVADAGFVVEGEYDDGNGMYYFIGVSKHRRA